MDEEKSTINWFPGHMAKAISKVKENLRKVNIVLEVRDARVPLTSGNPELHKVVGEKNHLIILNKVNLADPEVTKKWEKYFAEQGQPYVFLNSFDKSSVKMLHKTIKDIVFSKREEGSLNTLLRMMVIGLPNTGKSTLINHMAKRKACKAADKPGLTKQQLWVTITRNLELLDTPGIMPPNIETDRQGHWLCAIHAIKDEIVGEELVSIFVIEALLKKKSEDFLERYGLETFELTPMEVLDLIAQNRHFLRHGGAPDYERVYKSILADFRQGKLGRVSFEYPPEPL